MAKERLSKLQKWILVNWDNPKLHRQSQINPLDERNWRNTLWVYYNFFNIKSGEPTFENCDYNKPTKELKEKYKDYPKQTLTSNKSYIKYWVGYKVENKYVVITYRSLINLEKKGLITIPARCRRGKGNLLFELTDQGKELSLMLIKRQESAKQLTIRK